MRSAEEKRKAAREASRRWRQRNPEKARAVREAWHARNADTMRARWRDYSANRRRSPAHGLTRAQVAALLHSQGGRCAICRTDAPGGPHWHCDHNHDNGRVRAVLCHKCNVGIGCFKESPDHMRAALAYIEKHAALDEVL